MSASRREAEPRDYYWASENDPEKLAQYCINRVEDYQDQMRTSQYWNNALRNWRYFHNLFFDGTWDTESMAIKKLGRDGEQVGYSEGHFRNLVMHIFNLITQDRPSYQVRAKHGDQRSLKQAELGKHITNHYLEDQDLEDVFNKAVLDALVLQNAYVFHPWDPNSGEDEILAPEDEEGGEATILRTGDYRFWNLTTFDVVHDTGARNWKQDIQWCIVRTFENKWDIIDDVPKKRRDDVLALEQDEEFDTFHQGTFRLESEYSDMIPVWTFMHTKTRGLPDGRMLRIVGNDIPLGDPEFLPYKKIPLSRCIMGENLLTVFGYSPANDLQAPQEMLNAELSTIATNHNAHGLQHVWAPEDSNYDEDLLNEGLFLIKGGERPAQGVNLANTPPEFFKFSQDLRANMETLSGINAVARGHPEANLKSGEALKVMESKAVQFSTPGRRSYFKLVEDVGTFILRELPDKMGDTPRFIAMVGEDSKPYHQEFTGDEIDLIDRVVVESGNYLSQTISGRMAIADSFLERGFIKTPEEFITVLQTGNLEPMLRADSAELDLIHDENDKLMQGATLTASAADYHVMHIREHHALINSVEMRNSPIAAAIMAHIMQHIQLLQDINVQQLQLALNYTVPFPATQQGPGTGDAMGLNAAGGLNGGGGPPAQPAMVPGEPASPDAVMPGVSMGTFPER